MKKRILILILIILTTKLVLGLDITLNVEKDINVSNFETKEEITYESTNQKLKKSVSWLILLITATLCTLLILKR